MTDSVEALSSLLGEDKAQQLVKLTTKCDKYMSKFKKEVNSLLEDTNYQVLVGIAFKEKSSNNSN